MGCLTLLTACDLLGQYPWQLRVPITDVGAKFAIANATWFEQEQTLFVFYRVNSEQGLSKASEIELAYRTDEVDQDFVHIIDLPNVHQHVPATCGPHTICGSYSTPVELPPREVNIRLRYHRDGELTLNAKTDYYTVAIGAPHQSRSALVYGVFNRINTHVQWRLRHQFPAIRNELAEKLGLRRYFRIQNVSYGTIDEARAAMAATDNPYGYSLVPACPGPADFQPHQTEVIESYMRAVFDTTELPLDASTETLVCSIATVRDAVGEFSTAALAQKNPETRPAFPALQTPVTRNVTVPFLLEVCQEETPEGHREMQMQRLFLEESDVFCIDDYASVDFPSRLAARLLQDINAARNLGDDMVLTIALNRPNDPEIALRVEQALAMIVPLENQQSTPRLSGAFVYDSEPYVIQSPEVARLVLWCPAGSGMALPDTSQMNCAIQPVQDLALGEFSLAQLPILPAADQYETFVEKYGAHQTGYMTATSYRAPTRTPSSTNIPVGDFGVATFFNQEAITPDPDDAFSYCASEDSGLVVVRIPGVPELLPLQMLGDIHAQFALPRYELGLFWDFPFLTHMKYESHLATATNVPNVDFIIGFGLSSPAEQYMGGFQWEQSTFVIEDALLQCTRFCDHPTFDSSGVYNIDDLFYSAYSSRCYRPRFPAVGDDGYPSDP